MAGLAEYGGKLVHDAAIAADIVVLSGLSNLCECEFIDAVVSKKIVECKSKATLKRCGGRHTRS